MMRQAQSEQDVPVWVQAESKRQRCLHLLALVYPFELHLYASVVNYVCTKHAAMARSSYKRIFIPS